MDTRVKKSIMICFEMVVMALFFDLLDKAGIDKYIMTVAVTGILFFFFCDNKEEMLSYVYLLLPIAVYCGAGLLLSLCSRNVTAWTLKTVAFWTLPPLFSLVLSHVYGKGKSHLVDIQFYGCAIAYLFSKGGYILLIGQWESTLAFVFGLFVLYYTYRKKWSQVAVAALLMYFANKRIAVFAVVACLGLMGIMKLLQYGKKWLYIFWGLWMTAVGVYIYSICSGLFAAFCERFHIDTNTRLGVYMQVAEQIPDNNFFGQGLGVCNEMLKNMLPEWMFTQYYNNPHNDFLKFYVELGAIGLLLLLLSYFVVFYIAGKKLQQHAFPQLFVTIMYFMLLMTTDNVSIYISFLIPMYSVCFALMSERKEENENHAKSP